MPWAGTSPTKSGGSEPHPAWLWAFSRMGHPQFLWSRSQLVLQKYLKVSRFFYTSLSCFCQSSKLPPDTQQQCQGCVHSLHHRGKPRVFPGKNGLDMTSQHKKVQKVLFLLQGRSKTHFETLKVIVKWIHCLLASYSQLVGLQKKRAELL